MFILSVTHYLHSDREPKTHGNLRGVEVHGAAVDVHLSSKGVLRALSLEWGASDKSQASFKQRSVYFDFGACSTYEHEDLDRFHHDAF